MFFSGNGRKTCLTDVKLDVSQPKVITVIWTADGVAQVWRQTLGVYRELKLEREGMSRCEVFTFLFYV